MKWFLFVVFFLFNIPLDGQSNYQLKPEKESIIIGSALLMGGTSMILDLGFNPPTDAQILTAIPKVNRFDKIALNYNSLSADIISDVLLFSSALIPASLLLSSELEDERFEYLFMLGETVVLDAGLTYLVKSVTSRKRPYFYNEEIPLEAKQGLKASASFISGHTSMTSAISFFTARVYADLYPESKWKPIIWSGAAALPLVTGVMRIKAGKHYPTDVLAAIGVGAGIGLIIPKMHKYQIDGDHRLKIDFALNGVKILYSLN